jgi:quercetin dioxygenase-like cupin family protein
MIRCIRLFTGADGQSHVETQVLALGQTSVEGSLSSVTAVQGMQFAESPVGSHLDWHTAPCRQYVVTVSGVLLFENREGMTQRIEPGDVLLAEDLTGGGHRWRLLDE